MLRNIIRCEPSDKWKASSGIILANCWCAGLLLGILAAASAGETIASKMRSTVWQSVSIVPFLAYAPFLLSAIAIHLRQPWAILPCSFIKAFIFGFCAYAVTLAFGQSSWLMRGLFLFSDVASIPILYFYWLRCIKGNCVKNYWFSGGCAAAMFAVGIIDYCWVAPFTAALI